MGNTGKASKGKNKISFLKRKRDVQSQLKSARAAVAQAKQLAAKLTEIERSVAVKIEPILEKLDAFEARLDEVERNFLEQVKANAEIIAANMVEIARSGRGTETSSGTRKSAFGAIADAGFTGRRLPGSFESKG